MLFLLFAASGLRDGDNQDGWSGGGEEGPAVTGSTAWGLQLFIYLLFIINVRQVVSNMRISNVGFFLIIWGSS